MQLDLLSHSKRGMDRVTLDSVFTPNEALRKIVSYRASRFGALKHGSNDIFCLVPVSLALILLSQQFVLLEYLLRWISALWILIGIGVIHGKDFLFLEF